MIIYEITNKYTEMYDVMVKDKDELIFSKYYGRKDKAMKALEVIKYATPDSKTELYSLELKPLNREIIADILSMDHVRMHRHPTLNIGWNEVHDISKIIIREVKIK